MAPKMSIIIPTLQKSGNILTNLLKVLSADDAVEEIMVIDNSLIGYKSTIPKVKIIVPEENLYVNGAWNYGVKNMKGSFFGLLNDDIGVPYNFCSDVLKFLMANRQVGVLGYDSDDKFIQRDTKAFDSPPPNTKMRPVPLLKTVEVMYWGAAIFGHKTNYYQIPDNLKIYCGDNYLLLKNRENKKVNYQIKNQPIWHFGSMSASPVSRSFVVKDLEEYAKYEPSVLKNEAYIQIKQSMGQ